MKKLRWGELAYLPAMAFTAIGIRLQVNSGLGLSMVAAPGYILSQKIGWMTQGMAEWLIQGVVFLLLCLLLKKIPWKNVWSFLAAVPCSWALDLAAELVSGIRFDGIPARILLCLSGCVFLALGIALFFRSYLPCQVHEMFVKVYAKERGMDQGKMKSIYDFSFLGISLLLSFLFFGRLEGIGIGTVICTLCNGPLIHLWTKLMNGFINDQACFPKLKAFLSD